MVRYANEHEFDLVVIGSFGQDPFGYFLKKTLDDEGVDTSMLIQDEQSPTTLAFVSLQADGERDFVFNRGADGWLTYEELDHAALRKARIMHFGSATALLEDPFCAAYMRAMQDAKEQDILVSFDPNYRGNLWSGHSFVGDVSAFIARSRQAIGLCDVVKVSEEELHMIAGTQDRSIGVQILHELGAQVVTVTLGKEGTCLSNAQQVEVVPSISVNSIDSTGAGDAFVGAMLFQLATLPNPQAVLADFDQLQQMIAFANKVGALVCTQVGAISALPSYEEVE